MMKILQQKWNIYHPLAHKENLGKPELKPLELLNLLMD